MSKTSRRKFFLWLTGGLGALFASLWIFRGSIISELIFKKDSPDLKLGFAPGAGEDVCVLTSRQVEGPFYFPSPQRSDVREDREGREFNLDLQVINYPDCSPITNAMVDIWHCDGDGNYSGYSEEISRDVWKSFVYLVKNGEEMPDGEFHVVPENESAYLRGMQVTDENGNVSFKTIFPGWYVGRVPHIHVRITVDEETLLTTQLYFDEDMLDKLYANNLPYSKYGPCPMRNNEDATMVNDGDQLAGLKLNTEWDETQPLAATARIGIQRA